MNEDQSQKIYKLLVDMADKVSQRRQNANNFYLSVNTGIIGASAYIFSISQGAINIIIISVAGLAVSDILERGQNKSRYRPFYTVEVFVPFIFIGVYFVQIIRVVPWATFLFKLTHQESSYVTHRVPFLSALQLPASWTLLLTRPYCVVERLRLASALDFV